MSEELVIRFVLGGLLVSAFAALGELFQPKTLAGIFGAAPAVALAGLGLAFFSKGPEYASVETRSMLLGALALGCYSYLIARLLLRRAGQPLLVSGLGLSAWLAVAFGLWAVVLNGQTA